jgi:hypothetical protein
MTCTRWTRNGIKKRIITNVLNWGTKEATDLLHRVYKEEDIKEAIEDPLPGEWNKKSLNYLEIIYNTNSRSVAGERGLREYVLRDIG